VAAVVLHRVGKTYPTGQPALHAIDLEVGDGEFLVLVGPSGCGKSTLLRVIAGLESADAGTIHIAGRDMTEAPPQERDVAMVFQSYALYPHMSVRDNLAYGLRVRGTPASVVESRVREVAEGLGLEPFLARRPAQLSGGQRQRVALGRAMVRAPKAFLLDEPLSNLDPALRTQARAELLRLHRRLNATIVYVTHDQEEAMTLGQRVAVMRDGRLEQVGPPLDVYARPASTFVARFIGSPPMNLIEAPVPGVDAPPGTIVGIRPHDLTVGRDGPLRAIVDLVEPRGHDSVVSLRLPGGASTPLVAVTTMPPPAEGADVALSVDQSRLHLFDAATGTRLERSMS
jgi:ABC-type sugar transport system ATPase subunit